MAINEHPAKAPWEVPAATALTETESRADQADVLSQNGPPAGS